MDPDQDRRQSVRLSLSVSVCLPACLSVCYKIHLKKSTTTKKLISKTSLTYPYRHWFFIENNNPCDNSSSFIKNISKLSD